MKSKTQPMLHGLQILDFIYQSLFRAYNQFLSIFFDFLMDSIYSRYLSQIEKIQKSNCFLISLKI